MATKGYYKPQNPAKYKGDPTRIVYRSMWEFKFMRDLEMDNDVIQWSSEEIVIPYRSPIDGRLHRYFPDFWVKKLNDMGVIECAVIEVKPAIQTRAPAKKTKTSRRYIQEVATWGVNNAKWEAAHEYCKDRHWQFLIFTEHDLKIKV